MAGSRLLKKPRLRIQTKLLFVLLGISLIPLIVFAYIAQDDIVSISRYTIEASNSLGQSAAADSAAALEHLGTEIIKQKAQDVALQCRIFISSHPHLTLADLQRNQQFQKIAVQSVGKTGYTIVYERRTGIMRFHPNREIVNFDMHRWRDMLPEFWNLFEKTLDGSTGGGFYNWKDSDQVIRRKYMYMAPVEGTPYMVAATTYIDEFSRPVEETRLRIAAATEKIKEEVNRAINGIQGNFTAIMFLIVLLVVYVSFVMSRAITMPILALIKGAKAIGRAEMEYKVVVRTGDELEDLADSFNKMASDLKWHMEDLQCTTAEKERLQKELEIARGIQQRLLPQHAPEIEGIDVAASNLPAREIGGDFFDFIPVSLDAWGFVIADVSGKGMPAAIFMGLSRTLVRASTTDNPSAAAAIRQANELICRDSTSGMFVTLFYGVYETKRRLLRYVNAGHNPPLLIRRGNSEPMALKARGIALGVIHFIDLEERELTLEGGDILVCFTDGVTEAINADHEPFGTERLIEIVMENRQRRAGEIVAAIEKAVMDYAGKEPQFDDITLMVVKVL